MSHFTYNNSKVWTGRPAFDLSFPGNDQVRANNDPIETKTESVGVNNSQTGAHDANEVFSTLELPLPETWGDTSTTIDTSQNVSSTACLHKVQFEVQDTQICLKNT